MGNFIVPTDELIFFRGVETTNQIIVFFGGRRMAINWCSSGCTTTGELSTKKSVMCLIHDAYWIVPVAMAGERVAIFLEQTWLESNPLVDD